MFFRRMFARKESHSGDGEDDEAVGGEADSLQGRRHNNKNNNHSSSSGSSSNGGTYKLQRHRKESRKYAAATAPAATTAQKHCSSATTLHRVATSGPSGTAAVQLTPLWEHILRTRTLPETICPAQMFAEFLERLRDPEWQVRQHALRVLVDVLVVMRAKADAYMDPLIAQLIENLGHQAPTVRKGALDCLRVYLAETAMPETILLQILDIGLNQKITNEPFGGRLTCGVMLSLPALVQSTLHSPQRDFILRTTIDMLVQKMGQVTHQEITLKVLAKIRELIGEREFAEFLTHSAYREFELLCNVYGVGVKSGNRKTGAHDNGGLSWRIMAQQQPPQQLAQNCWRSSSEEEERMLEVAGQAKVIMETEIKINEDTLTMRILEAKDDDEFVQVAAASSPHKSQDTYPNSLEDEVVCGRLLSAKSDVVQLLSDSDEEEINGNQNETTAEPYTMVTPSTPSRTPKRVTFGGEVVKMRTPDSDAASSNNHNKSNSNNNENTTDAPNSDDVFGSIVAVIPNSPTDETAPAIDSSKTTALSLEIPNDNTKPLARPKSAHSPKHVPDSQQSPATVRTSPVTTTHVNSAQSPIKRKDSATSLSPRSPRSPFKRISISPVDSIISPKTPHKEIEVLHNLQRDPSPVRGRSARKVREEVEASSIAQSNAEQQQQQQQRSENREEKPPPKSWEELGIVDYDTLLDLRSGDWRHRLQGIVQLEEALRSSEKLALVQPCLDSLLRTLLSSERNPDVAEEKRRLLSNLISRLPLDNLEDRTVQILTGLCRQGGSGANRVCKALMQRLPPAAIVLKLISDDFLHTKSSRFREQALQMVMYALMTFPSTYFDTTTCISSATHQALNRKRRVRQAALDVLAILGQVSTARAVLDVVQSIGDSRDDGAALMAAVKARLSRKQLPLVSADGLVQYTLRMPSPHTLLAAADGSGNGQLGPDVEWITAGVGSVSPTSMKRRAHKNRSSSQQSFRCLPQQDAGVCVVGGGVASAAGSNHSDDSSTHRHSFRSPQGAYGNGNAKDNATCQQNETNNDNQPYTLQHMLANSIPMHFGLASKKSNDYSNYMNRRLVAKSCSDSSMDGRSSDSTYTSSNGSGGGSGCAAAGIEGGVVAVARAAGGITGRFTRQAVNSRFPAMDRMDPNSTYVRVHKPPPYYPGMGAYAQLQQQQMNMSSTYPKINYTMPTQNRRRSHQPQFQQSYQQQQQQQQQHQQQAYYAKAQETFKQTENLSNEHSYNNNNNNGNLNGTYAVLNGNDNTTTKVNGQQQQQFSNVGNSSRRFVNVEKFIMQSNKSSQTNGVATAIPTAASTTATTTPTAAHTTFIEPKGATPTSMKSATYSEKSTASAQSSNSDTLLNTRKGETTGTAESATCSTPTTTLVATLKGTAEADYEVSSESPAKWATGEEVLQLEDVVDGTMQLEDEQEAIVPLKRNESLVSLQSKAESIKTQLEDSPSVLSRTQSVKSLVIEENIEEANGSFVVVEEMELEQQVMEMTTATADLILESGSSKESLPLQQPDNDTEELHQPVTPKSRPQSRSHSPTIAELKTLSRRNSMIKSMESLYERPPVKQDSLDNSTESSSNSSQLNAALPAALKTQHTPLKQKAKTMHFLKSHRRVSPVKKSIKMAQAELFPPTLQRFEKPREGMLKTFDQLDDSSWEVIVLGLKSIVRLMRYHPEYLETQLHMVCIHLTRSVRNLRSQVSRAACQAATELFTLRSKNLEQECDDLVCALLHRTADTNRFLRADATRALESMCDSLTPPKILNILTTKGALHQNAVVRTTAAKLLHRLVERLGCEKIFTMPRENRDKFFVTGANLLLEGSLETRSYAKSLFRLLSDHPNYHRLLLEIIPQRTYRNVEKTLKSIR